MTNEDQGSGVRGPAEDGVDVVTEDTQHAAAQEGKEKKGSFWRELPVLILIALLLALLIKSFVVQAFYIPSESMENTLLKNDRVFVNKLVYRMRDIERGDIVVFSGVDSWDEGLDFEEPSNPISALFREIGVAFSVIPGEKDYIKRVIGVPGDKVKCCDGKHRITVNGVAIDEQAYLYPNDRPSDRTFEVTVPKGRLWVMGDHRSVSVDSRFHMGDPGGGTIPVDQVIGRAFVIVWPLDRAEILPIPATFGKPALQAAASAVPLVGGFAGAIPLVALRRRIRAKR
jgi:signal peptidase I